MNALHPILISRIDSICAKYGPLADDVASHVMVKLVEKFSTDQHFARQQIGYHIKFAKWEAQKYMQAAARYDKYVTDEPQLVDQETGDVAPFFEEMCSANEPGVEEQVIAHEFEREVESALDRLPPHQRRVAHLLMADYRPNEIAYKLGISQSGVSKLASRLQATMQAAFA